VKAADAIDDMDIKKKKIKVAEKNLFLNFIYLPL